MKWLQHLIERVCQTTQVGHENGTIRLQNYSISIRKEDDLYSIRVVDLIYVKPPIISKPMYHDEIEEELRQTINSL